MIKVVNVRGGRESRGKFNRVLIDTNETVFPGDIYTRRPPGSYHEVFRSLSAIFRPGKDEYGVARYKVIALFP